jgi:predicted small secreted protein
MRQRSIRGHGTSIAKNRMGSAERMYRRGSRLEQGDDESHRRAAPYAVWSECRSAPLSCPSTGRGDAMIKKLVLLLAALGFGATTLTACNTMQGAGRDVEKAGQKVQEEAQEHKKY